MAEDQEFIYPYWNSIIPQKYSGRQIPWNNMEEIGSVWISPHIANQLRFFEKYGGFQGAIVCGRFYEAVFNDFIDSKSTLEGAPIDGFLESSRPERQNMDPDLFNAPYRFLIRNRRMPYYPWEMKKLTLSTGKCNFNSQNISAIMALGGGYAIGATVSFVENKIYYRAKYISTDAPP